MKNPFHKAIQAALLVTLTILIVSTYTVNADTLFVSNSTGLMNAASIPANSPQWSVYSRFNSASSTQYYSVLLERGQTVNVMLSVPASEPNFYPNLQITGPGFSSDLSQPQNAQVPPGYNTILVLDQQGTAPIYNPLIPSATYTLSTVSFTAPETATYYFIVDNGNANATYELSSPQANNGPLHLSSLITLSVDSLGIYDWELEPLPFVVLPLLLTFLIGNVLILNEYEKKEVHLCSFNFWAAVLAGIFFFASAATLFLQMIISLAYTHAYASTLPTLVIIIASAILGAYALMLAPNAHLAQDAKLKKRAFLTGIGIVAFFAGIGFIIGPILAVLAGIAPSNLLSGDKEEES